MVMKALPALLLSLLLVATSSTVKAEDEPQQPPPSSTAQGVLQKMRQLLGLTRPLAAGGSRGAAERSICLLVPVVSTAADGSLQGVALLAEPTLVSATPLNEVRITRNGVILWQQLATLDTPIEGPIAWPIDPLRAGERLTLELRPRGSAGGDRVVLPLQAAPAERMERLNRQFVSYGSDPDRWRGAVVAAIDEQDAPLVSTLLFHPDLPPFPERQSWREEVIKAACPESLRSGLNHR